MIKKDSKGLENDLTNLKAELAKTKDPSQIKSLTNKIKLMEVEIALQKVIENPNDAALLKKFKEKLAKLSKDSKLEIETLISKLNDFKCKF